MSKMQRRVAMFHIGRSGSTVVGNQLSDHPAIDWIGEVYVEGWIDLVKAHADGSREACYPFDAITLVQKRAASSKAPVFGLEVKPNHLKPAGMSLDDYIRRIEQLEFRDFIILERRNTLRKIASSLVASRTGAWHITRGLQAKLNHTEIPVDSLTFELETKPLIDFLQEYDQQLKSLKKLFETRRSLHLSYELDVKADPKKAYRKVVNFLGLELIDSDVKLSRTNPFPLRDIIRNSQEVAAALHGTAYEWMLED